MKLTVMTPVLNEAAFLPFYLDSVTSFADEVIIVDGGSTDNSLELIRQYQKRHNIHLFEIKQTGMPYSDDWNESLVRNFMIDRATGQWIANIDADEVFDDRFAGVLPQLMHTADFDVYQFPFINFWENPWKIRVNAPSDERWSNDIIRLWRHGIGIRYESRKHHCTLQTADGQPIWSARRTRVDIPLYHYHYALGNRIKFNDNRRGDLNVWTNEGEPDWTYNHGEYPIITEPFNGTHPAVVRRYLDQLGR
ncbi:glycosyltransferase [Cohnella sp. CFH 77786]|uniref:glycosyltransferase n=1 Tax=Cohnella sp. CFH 77786 TaxID=2662265 RepID=UPI001C60A005|nr:glycosyltransferase [Cohnella sp. CFH 77786]MBW5447673.1 glycosyltransferase [Cohnella sp. CFH 77786]